MGKAAGAAIRETQVPRALSERDTASLMRHGETALYVHKHDQ